MCVWETSGIQVGCGQMHKSAPMYLHAFYATQNVWMLVWCMEGNISVLLKLRYCTKSKWITSHMSSISTFSMVTSVTWVSAVTWHDNCMWLQAGLELRNQSLGIPHLLCPIPSVLQGLGSTCGFCYGYTTRVEYGLTFFYPLLYLYLWLGTVGSKSIAMFGSFGLLVM